MRSAIHPRLVAAGVEEEFHIVDLATRRLTGQADRLMGQLPADRFSWEMQRSVVEANSGAACGAALIYEGVIRQQIASASTPALHPWALASSSRSQRAMSSATALTMSDLLYTVRGRPLVSAGVEACGSRAEATALAARWTRRITARSARAVNARGASAA
jgi:hypothetical protein